MHILVTRARQDAALTAVRLRALGHEPVCAPVLEILPLEVVWPQKPRALIATSAHAFIQPPPIGWHDLPLYVVGETTARAATQMGFTKVTPVRGDVGNLTRLLAMNESFGLAVSENSGTLYLAGKHRKPVLETAFPAVATLETYEARACDHLPDEALKRLKSNRIDIILHYSRRSTEILLRLIHQQNIDLTELVTTHICLSRDVSVPFQTQGFDEKSALRVKIAAFPDETSLMDLI